MKYLAIDLETTRLAPRSPDGILMAAFVVEDTAHPEIPLEDLPSITVIVDPGASSTAAWSPMAMAMNGWILLAIEISKVSGRPDADRRLGYLREAVGSAELFARAKRAAERYLVVEGTQGLVAAVMPFLGEHFGSKPVTVAGKNAAGFDVPFLPAEIGARMSHKVIDPGSVFVDWQKDAELPGMAKCLERAGISMPGAAHDALADARAVVALLRSKYGALQNQEKTP